MKKYNATETLYETIALLEYKKAKELIILKEQFQFTYESLKPINIIKNAFSEITNSSDIKGNLLNNVVRLLTDISRKVLLGSSQNLVKRVLGSIFQFVVRNVVTKNSDAFKSKV
jgi:hypothetical protein